MENSSNLGMKFKLGPAEIRTQIPEFKAQSANQKGNFFDGTGCFCSWWQSCTCIIGYGQFQFIFFKKGWKILQT